MYPAHAIKITCTLSGTPLFSPFISLMFLVFVARLYWLVSAVSQAFFHSSRFPQSCFSLSVFVYLIIYVVSPSTLSLSVYSSRTWLKFRLTTTTIPALRFCTSALCLPVTIHACPTDPTLDFRLHPCLPAHDLWIVALSLWFMINRYFLPELGLAIGSFKHFLTETVYVCVCV